MSTTTQEQIAQLKREMLERIYADAVGMCSRCGEFTPLTDPCCNALIWYGGSLVDPSQAVSDDE